MRVWTEALMPPIWECTRYKDEPEYCNRHEGVFDNESATECSETRGNVQLELIPNLLWEKGVYKYA